MDIDPADITVEVEVKALMTLDVADVDMSVRERVLRIKRARVYWAYQDDGWAIDFVQVEGPFLRKSDGAEAKQFGSQATHPARPGGYGLVTPGEIVEYAVAHPPNWTPILNASPYRREGKWTGSS